MPSVASRLCSMGPPASRITNSYVTPATASSHTTSATARWHSIARDSRTATVPTNAPNSASAPKHPSTAKRCI